MIIRLRDFQLGSYNISVFVDDILFIENINSTGFVSIGQYLSLHLGHQEVSLEITRGTYDTIYSYCFDVYVREVNTVYVNNFGDKITIFNYSPRNFMKSTLFVEGFEILPPEGAHYMDELIDKWVQDGLDSDLVCLLTFGDNSRDMRDNAMSLLAALKFIYFFDSEQDITKEGVSVVGHSMGGVIARYALAFAEDNNIPHYCTQYVSIDSPHRGASLNHDFQSMIKELRDFLNGTLVNGVAGHNDDFKEQKKKIDRIYNNLGSPAAKQLIRKNILEPGNYNYSEGSAWFQYFFSEINQEERNICLPSYRVLNDDSSDSNNKPGFPYKQNNIKCMSYSNGSLEQSGNINNVSELASFDIDIAIFHENGDASSLDYDKQPASVVGIYLPDYNDGGFGYDFDAEQNYDLPFIPTRSSLYIKDHSISDSNVVDPQFSIANYNAISIPSDYATLPEEYLEQFSYFDKVFFASSSHNAPGGGEWNWTHVDGFNGNISLAAEWMNDVKNSATTMISGNIANLNIQEMEDITIKVYLEDQDNLELPLSDPYNRVNLDNTWNVPYSLLESNNIRLVFSKNGYIPTSKRLYVDYDSLSNAIQPIAPISINMCPLSTTLIVSQDGTGSFDKVQDALDHIYETSIATNNYPNNYKIFVLSGIYSENLEIKRPSRGLSKIEIIGSANQTIFKGGNSNSRIINLTSLYDNGDLDSFVVKNITFDGGGNDLISGAIYCNEQLNNLSVDNCIIRNFELYEPSEGNSDYPSHESLLANTYINTNNINGIAVYSDCPTVITNSKIYNNIGISHHSYFEWVNDNYQSSIGVIDLAPSSKIENCEIYNNQASIAGAINLRGINNEIVNNKIYNNNSVDPNYNALAIRCSNVSSTVISDNLLYDNGCGTDLTPGSVIWFEDCGNDGQIILSNNTFTNSPSTQPPSSDYPVELNAIKLADNCNILMSNNIFTKYIVAINNTNQVANNNVQKHNLFWENGADFLGDTYDITVNPGSCLFQDPLLSEDYTLIWDENHLSPCIDAGWGENDPDGTQADIGAYRTREHAQWSYTFRKANQNATRSEEWHWVSYPVINSLTLNKTQKEEFFSELLITDEGYNPTVLDQIIWFKDSPYLIKWDNGNWTGFNTGEDVNSIQGYKVRLLPQQEPLPINPSPVELHHIGFKTSPSREFTITGNGIENWIGYFREESTTPEKAFSAIWDDIISIKASSWNLFRDSATGFVIGKSGTINYGDMVIVRTNNSHQFQWESTSGTPPYYKSKAVNFDYDEKPDYTPVYVDLGEQVDTIKEIGLFINNECKGAVTVEEENEMICAYLDDGEVINQDEISLELIYDQGKGKQTVKKRSSNDLSIKTNYINGRSDRLYTLILGESIDSPPVMLNLSQNYPNPFNPDTTINFSIEQSGRATLAIYNLKGQLIDKVFDKNVNPGTFNVVWKGTDSHGNKCANGIYFYKLTSGNNDLVKKMVLLK